MSWDTCKPARILGHPFVFLVFHGRRAKDTVLKKDKVPGGFGDEAPPWIFLAMAFVFLGSHGRRA